MDRVLVVGDVHGNAPWWVRVCEAAKANDCPGILQLGDFGWWPHAPRVRVFLEAVALTLDEYGLDCWFCDGNHENFRDLWSHSADADGSVRLGPHLRYLPRGHAWTWGGRRFLALGGAHSLDQGRRRPGISWWPEELIRDEDVARAIEAGPADVLVSHDAPTGIETWRRPGMQEPQTPDAANRRRVRQVVDSARPEAVLHAHYHRRYTSRLVLDDGHVVRVEGLGRDKDETGNWLVLDVADLATSAALP